MKLIRLIASVFNQLVGHTPDNDGIMDHVPVQKVADDGNPSLAQVLAEKRKLAEQRHGKQFLADTKIVRVSERSRDLIELDAASNPKPGVFNVSKFKQK